MDNQTMEQPLYCKLWSDNEYLFHCTVPHPLVCVWLEADGADCVLPIAVLAGEVSPLALVHLSRWQFLYSHEVI